METDIDSAGVEKPLLVLLNGISRIEYDEDEASARQLLRSHAYPDLPEEEFSHLFDRMTQLIRTMTSSNMDLKQTEAFLTSQTKRREGKISEGQAKTLSRFWKANRTRIHETTVRRSTAFGTPAFKGLRWRVEVPTHRGGGEDDQLTPVAIVQIKCSGGTGGGNRKDDTDTNFSFELNEKDLSALTSTMDEIDAQITSMSN